MPEIHASRPQVLLVVAAAPKEVQAIRSGLADGELPIEILETGVGKSAAAASVAARLAASTDTAPAVFGVLNAGLGGALPPWGAEAIGRAVIASRTVFGDEGVDSPEGFQPMESLGFGSLGPKNAVIPPETLLVGVRRHVDDVSVVATVSSCSGMDNAAGAIAERTGARVEAMEGAAVGLACQRAAVPFLELRVISNTTGDRAQQVWQLEMALDRLGSVTSSVARAWIAEQMFGSDSG